MNSNPATIMTDPEFAHRTYIEPITPEVVEKIIEREKPDALLPTLGGQTALNCAMKLVRIGRAGEAQRADDRRQCRGDSQGRGPPAFQGGHAQDRPRYAAIRHGAHHRGSAQGRRGDRHVSAHHPARLHPRRHRRRHRLQSRGIRRNRRARPRSLARERGAHRGIAARLEGIRDGGHARPRGQLRHHLLDREFRSDGRAHRRLDHRRAGADAHGQGIPAHARRVASRSSARSASRPAARTSSLPSIRRPAG